MSQVNNGIDLESEKQFNTFVIFDGADASLFNINRYNGSLSFKSPAIFDNKNSTNNEYNVVVQKYDGDTHSLMNVYVEVVKAGE